MKNLTDNPTVNPLPPKSNIRHTLLQTRENLTAAQQTQSAQRVSHNLDYVFKTLGIKTAAAYLPIRGELDVTTFCATKSNEVQWLLPYCPADDNERRLAFLPWQPGEPLTPGRYNIPVPSRHLTDNDPLEHALALHSIDAILLPCVGINLRGYRLGYGAGWYDRTLTRHSRDTTRHSRESGNPAHPLHIGLVYHAATYQDWQEEPHDHPLDLWISEEGIFGGRASNL